MTPSQAHPLPFRSLAVALSVLLLGACSRPSQEEPRLGSATGESRQAREKARLQTDAGDAQPQADESDTQRAQEEVQRFQRLFASLPHCTPEDVAEAIEVGRLTPAQENSEVRVRGVPAPLSNYACTLMACINTKSHRTLRCCNGCGGSWFLTSPALRSADAVMVEPTSPAEALKGWRMLDCAVQDLNKTLPLPEVIALGTLRQSNALPLTPPGASGGVKHWSLNVSRLCVP